MDTVAFNRQLGDLMWMLSMALKAGYEVHECFQELAHIAPDPSGDACERVYADLNFGLSLDGALTHLNQIVSSSYLEEIIQLIKSQQRTGENLSNLLDILSEELVHKLGSDPAFYPAMRDLAISTGAPLPERTRR
jgi:Flp pilus assembly protein TadB